MATTQSPSSTPSSTQTTNTKPPQFQSQGPTPLLPTPFARIYSLAHPALLLALLALRFSSLVENPVAELLGDIPYLVGLQVVFVMGCLPPAGSEREPGSEKSSGGGAGGHGHGHGPGVRRRGKSSSSTNWSSGLVLVVWKLTPALLSLTLTTLLTTPLYALLLILFGAPLTTHQPHTFLCAAHMALLSTFPLIYVHGVDGATWREIWGAWRPVDSVWGGALGAILGAWAGAVPVPLDWDRPWQAYPITILTGAYIGYAAGTLIGQVKGVYGKRIEFAPGPKTDEQVKEQAKVEGKAE